MDATEKNMTLKELLERIAELDYSKSQLRDLNAEMRHWLDLADDEVTTLRSENDRLRQQVKSLEKIISEAQQVEAEPCRSALSDNLDVKRFNEKEIQELERESTKMKEQNKKLTAELKSLQQERDQDKSSLSKFRVALQTTEWGLEEAQLELQRRDEVIHQDLRLTNQELRKQLEDRQAEASFAILNDVMVEKEGSLSAPLSFAEEIKLLTSSAEVTASMSDFTDLRHEETETEEQLESHSLTMDLRTQRRAGILESVGRRAGLFMLFIFIIILAFGALGSSTGNFFSINTLWSSAGLMLQPYCSVHYDALPPI
uniref:uncharacterized protein LOC124068724 isoform X2 n=1 Tax=Scatophagus argus TaxID=75038 RepID=UPI001ED825C2|nr:uncharacterized protein LOC124068724 isoform X2 [Scatophagus argus]